jgi:hypothetical protein
MADEIENANVIVIVAETPHGPWRASIGQAVGRSPGLGFTAPEPMLALEGLVERLPWIGWPFDPTWRPHVS